MKRPGSVDEYLATLPEERRAGVVELRTTIGGLLPGEARETISYGMPAFTLDGRGVVWYAAFRAHYSLFPASDGVVEALGDAVTPYLAGKGTIRFPANNPLPIELVRRIVEVRLTEHAVHGRS